MTYTSALSAQLLKKGKMTLFVANRGECKPR